MAKKEFNLNMLASAVVVGLFTTTLTAATAATSTNDKVEQNKLSETQNKIAATNSTAATATLPAGTFSSKDLPQDPTPKIIAQAPHGKPLTSSRPSARFGDWRWRPANHGVIANFHEGYDIANGIHLPLYAPWPGITTKTTSTGIAVRNNQGGSLQYLHSDNLIGFNKNVTTGQQVSNESNVKADNIHLHLQYVVPPGKQLFSTWLGQRAKGGTFGREVVSQKPYSMVGGKPVFISTANSRRVSDPAPNLSFDVIYPGDTGERYSKWIGSTARQQFNYLYGANLPIGGPHYGSGRIIKPTVPFPAVTSFDNWTSLSGGSANMSSVNAMGVAEDSGYVSGGSYISYQALASFLSSDDGAEFGSLAPLIKPVDVSDMSTVQIVHNIANQRFGNTEWNKAIAKLSTKGMMTEYLMMIAEENFLRYQLLNMRNRVEFMIAGLTRARMHEYSKKVDTLQALVSANAIPKIINRAIESSGDEYITTYDFGVTPSIDTGPLPADIEGVKKGLLNVIFRAESSDNPGGWNASNNGTIGNSIVCPRASGGVFNLTSMTLGQMKQIYRASNENSPRNLNDCSRLFAAGRYQIIFTTFKSAQKMAGIPDSALFSPETQTKMAEALLMYRVGSLLRNKGQSLDAAKTALSQEWASLGLPGASCHNNKMKGYHGGANGAKCDVTYRVWSLLEQAWKINHGGA